jgi:superfamily II DNA or RNA helicase
MAIAVGDAIRIGNKAPVFESLAQSAAGHRMDQDGLVGDIVTHWHRYGERRRTVCFAVNVAHSMHIRNEFVRSGVRAEHIDGSTPKPVRDAALKRLESGETELITNCMVLSEGWDMPQVGCCILARPTKQMGLYRQMIGRVLRPAADKPDCIVLDHSGAVYRHGLVEDDVVWTLDPDKRVTAPKHAACRHALGYTQRLIACTKCGAVRITGSPCGACGFMPAPPPREQITNAWKRVVTMEQAEAIASTARANKNASKVSHGRRTSRPKSKTFPDPSFCHFPTPVSGAENGKFPTPETGVTGPAPETGVTIDISGGGGDAAAMFREGRGASRRRDRRRTKEENSA